MPQLVIKWGHQEHYFTITTPTITIGRAETNILQLRDIKISRYHCQIVQTPEGYLLNDSESSNGTSINGKRMQRGLLHHNDVIRLGGVEIIFSEGLDRQTKQNEQQDKKTVNGSPQQTQPVQTISKPMVLPKEQTSEDEKLADETTAIMSMPQEVKTTNPLPNKQLQQRSQNNSNQRNNITPTAQKTITSIRTLPQVNNKPQVISNVVTKPAPVLAKISNNQPSVMNKTPINNKKTPLPGGNNKISEITPVRQTSFSGNTKPLIAKKEAVQTPNIKAKLSRTPSSLSKTPPKISKFSKSTGSKLSSKHGQNHSTEEGKNGDASKDTGKQKKKNLLFILGGVGVVVIVILGFILSSGANQKAKEDSKRESSSFQDAEDLYEKKDYKEALKKYEEFLKEFDDSKYASKAKEKINKIKSHEESDKQAKSKYTQLVRKKKDYPTKQYPELLKEYEQFIKDYPDSSIINDAKGDRDTIKRIAASEQGDTASQLFNEMMAEVNKLINQKKYDDAMAKLEEIRKKVPSLNDRQQKTINDKIEEIKDKKK